MTFAEAIQAHREKEHPGEWVACEDPECAAAWEAILSPAPSPRAGKLIAG